MGDLPGPEKPLFVEETNGHKANANELMAAFRARVAAGGQRLRPAGAGGHGAYDGRSGRFLKGRVRERHKMVVALECAGWKNNEIAAALDYTPSRVSVILNSKHPELLAYKTDVAKRVADNTIDMHAKFLAHAPDAFNRMVDIMNQKGDVAQARLAARDILDRAGYSPVKKVAAMHANVPIERLVGVMGQIEKANEAVARQGEWEVMEVKEDGAA